MEPEGLSHDSYNTYLFHAAQRIRKLVDSPVYMPIGRFWDTSICDPEHKPAYGGVYRVYHDAMSLHCPWTWEVDRHTTGRGTAIAWIDEFCKEQATGLIGASVVQANHEKTIFYFAREKDRFLFKMYFG